MPIFKNYLLLLLFTLASVIGACNKDNKTSNNQNNGAKHGSKTLTPEQIKEGEQKRQADYDKWAKLDRRVLTDTTVTAENAQMKATGLKIKDSIFQAFCTCHLETDKDKKVACELKLRDFFERARKVASNPNATYEEFYKEMTKNCK